MPHADRGAWDILQKFAGSEMTLPDVEAQLQQHLGDCYDDKDWRPALSAVMNAEGNFLQAHEAINKLAAASQLPRLTIKLPGQSCPSLYMASGIINTEKKLMESVDELMRWRQIIGKPPTLEDLVDPIEEHKPSDSPYRFEGGDDEIVAKVQHELAVARGKVIEIDDSDSEDKDDKEKPLSQSEVLKLCEGLEKVCLQYGSPDTSFELLHHLHTYRGQLRHEELCNCSQASLDTYFAPK